MGSQAIKAGFWIFLKKKVIRKRLSWVVWKHFCFWGASKGYVHIVFFFFLHIRVFSPWRSFLLLFFLFGGGGVFSAYFVWRFLAKKKSKKSKLRKFFLKSFLIKTNSKSFEKKNPLSLHCKKKKIKINHFLFNKNLM